MKAFGIGLKTLAVLSLLVLAYLVEAAVAGPSANFSLSPAGPTVGQEVLFLDASTGSPTAWSWNLGDGTKSDFQNPTHTYGAPGVYEVTLTVSSPSGSSQKTEEIFVTSNDTLRLLSSHPFDVTLSARDPRTGNTGAGFALPQTDVFGYFSIPALTFNPGNPEVCVKIVDGTSVNGKFWVFYAGMTDFEYTATITEVATGLSKSYVKPAGSTQGGFDTSAFSGGASSVTGALLAGGTRATFALPPRPFGARSPDSPLGESVLIEPTNPAAGQAIDFYYLETVPTSGRTYQQIVWDFGDGTTSTQPNTTHVYTSSGDFNVKLTDPFLHANYSGTVWVSPSDTLRLNSGLPGDDYNIDLTVKDQRTGRFATGKAFANNSFFGSFSLPALTGNPNNAEVFTKVLNGTAINGNVWSFRGNVTDTQFTMRYQKQLSLAVKYEFKAPSTAFGAIDISGFDDLRAPGQAHEAVIDSLSPTQGPYGTQITINGRNLHGMRVFPFFQDPGTSVPFNYEPLRLRVQSITQDSQGGDHIQALFEMPCAPIKLEATYNVGVYVDHYVAIGPEFTVLPGADPNVPTFQSFNPTHGIPGTQVTLNGTNFQFPGTTVKFSRRELAPILSQSATTILTQVPAGTVTGSIEVFTPYGEARSPSLFTIDEPATTPSPTPEMSPTVAPPPTSTPAPEPSATEPPTATPTPVPTNPSPTPASGAPQIIDTDAPNNTVADGSLFDIFGVNLADCTSITVTFENGTNTYTLICKFGDGSSVQVQVPVSVIPPGTYKICAKVGGKKGCSAFSMVKQ